VEWRGAKVRGER
jgi:hypothetical protein